MFQNVTLYQFCNFSLFAFSIIVFIDVLFQLKRPLLLKLYFLILTASVGVFSLLMWISKIHIVILLLFPILKFLIWTSMALILSHLYVGKKKQWIYWCILIAASILVYSLVRVYNYYSEIQYSVVANSLSPVNLFTAKFSFKVNLLPRICILSIFTFINFRLFFFIYKKSDSENHYTGLIKNWTKTFVILEFVSVSVFGIMNSTLFSYDFGNIMLLFIGYFILLIVLYRPRFINSQGVKVSLTSNFNRDEKFLLTDANFYKPFFINQYYLNEDATLELFCKQNGITSNEFLQNQVVKKYNMTFGNLVNKSRVEYFIELVKSPKYAHYSIEALAKEAGFNSRHHLYKPFKKFHGGTPSDFISSINN